jgi:hypothetical protein
MKPFVKGLIAFFGILLISVSAHAQSFLLEPYLGYNSGKIDTGTEYDLSGVNYGVRLGYGSANGFMAGFDYMMGNWTYKTKPNSSTLNPKDAGLFFGYQWPESFRLYAEYVLDSVGFHSVNSSKGVFTGTAIKAGVGYTITTNVAINLEYIQHDYDKSNGSDADPDITTKIYGLNVSFPLNF